LLFAVFVFWTNVHAGPLGGRRDIRSGDDRMLRGSLAWLANRHRGQTTTQIVHVAAGLVVASIFVNPYGWEMPKVWLSLSSFRGVTRLIKSTRLDPTKTPDVYVVIVAAIYLAVLLERRCVHGASHGYCRFCGCHGVRPNRHAPLFAVVVACVLWKCSPIAVAAETSNPAATSSLPKEDILLFRKVNVPFFWQLACVLLIFMRSDGKNRRRDTRSDIAPVELLPAIRNHLGRNPDRSGPLTT